MAQQLSMELSSTGRGGRLTCHSFSKAQRKCSALPETLMEDREKTQYTDSSRKISTRREKETEKLKSQCSNVAGLIKPALGGDVIGDGSLISFEKPVQTWFSSTALFCPGSGEHLLS